MKQGREQTTSVKLILRNDETSPKVYFQRRNIFTHFANLWELTPVNATLTNVGEQSQRRPVPVPLEMTLLPPESPP